MVQKNNWMGEKSSSEKNVNLQTLNLAESYFMIFKTSQKKGKDANSKAAE